MRTSLLPSKRVIALIIACILIVAALIATKWDRTPIDTTYENENKGPVIVVEGSLRNSSGKDSDNDGLLDWEESLWKSNPNMADTDGDGTTDGEEVDQKRDPSKKGPDDKIALTATGTATAPAEPSAPLNETETLSRDLLTGYIEARDSGDFAASSEALVNNLAANQAGTKSTAYSDKNVSISPASGKTALEDYAGAMGKVLVENPPEGGPNELDTMDIAINQRKPEELQKLDPVIRGYQALVTGFAKVSVPKELATSHIQLLNNLDTVLTDLRNFKKMFSDPIVGFSALARYYGDVEDLRITLEDIQTYFAENEISFEQSEYGYAFLNII